MLNNTKIKKMNYCRECLNEQYGIQLHRDDVMIFEFPLQCHRCRQTKNIVAKVRTAKQWKLILAHDRGK